MTRILDAAEDVTPDVLEAVAQCMDWFEGSPLRTEEFIDRLCDSYGDGWDIENYVSPAAKRIMREARALRRAEV